MCNVFPLNSSQVIR